MGNGYPSLTDKEKEALRLILRGHDAKSMARELDLSVHTVNERLRNARRKLAVTSSKEAARLLLQAEEPDPHSLVPKPMGDAAQEQRAQDDGASRAGMSPARVTIGVLTMTILLAAVALSLTPVASDDASPDLAMQARESGALAVASRWIELVDSGNWEASYEGTDSTFRKLNTLAVWRGTAQAVQADLGATLSRRLEAVDHPPTPQDYWIVKFRTNFANREGAVETISLVREDGAWKVAGIFVS